MHICMCAHIGLSSYYDFLIMFLENICSIKSVPKIILLQLYVSMQVKFVSDKTYKRTYEQLYNHTINNTIQMHFSYLVSDDDGSHSKASS